MDEKQEHDIGRLQSAAESQAAVDESQAPSAPVDAAASWETAKPPVSTESKVDAPVALAIIAVILAFLNVSFSTGGGIDFGFGIIGAMTMGAGALYTIFAVLWDILFIGATVLVLVATIMRSNDSKQGNNLIIGGLSFCVAILVLDIVFAILARSAGLQNFSLLELMIVLAYGSDVNLVTQFLIYGGALVVFIVAARLRNAKVALIGLSIVAALALVTLVCGLQPFAYSVGGVTIFGQTIPRVTTYYITEFVSMTCLWVAIILYALKAFPKEAKSDDAGEEK